MSAPARALDLSQLAATASSGVASSSSSRSSSFCLPPPLSTPVVSPNLASGGGGVAGVMAPLPPPPVAPHGAAAGAATITAFPPPIAAPAVVVASTSVPATCTTTTSHTSASSSLVASAPSVSASTASSSASSLAAATAATTLSSPHGPPSPIAPPPAAAAAEKDHPITPGECIHYTAPPQLVEPLESIVPAAVSLQDCDAVEPYVAPPTACEANHKRKAHPCGEKSDEDDDDDDCPICLDPLSKLPAVRIAGCKHVFHQPCITDCLHREPKCPVCRTAVNGANTANGTAAALSLQGKCPTGTLKCRVQRTQKVPGFDRTGAKGTIELHYDIPGGLQHEYHDHPGVPYQATSRVAYLPNNAAGRDVLARLQTAWRHGLIFTVGTSLTSGQPNVVTWTSIHHKTSLHGGVHGFPDDQYIPNVHGSLDAAGVPAAAACPAPVLRGTLPYQAPTTLQLSPAVLQSILQPVDTMGGNASSNHVSDCALCSAALQDAACEMPAVQIKQCRHAFHRPCLETYCQQQQQHAQQQQQQQNAVPAAAALPAHSNHPTPTNCLATCPICRVPFGKALPRPLRPGKGPSGTMTIQVGQHHHNHNGNFLELHYHLPDGIQNSYNVLPGARFTGCRRLAYVPNTVAGRRLVTRLKYSFAQGLSFDIGTSLTSGRSNVVVWSHHVPHKTATTGSGPFGFPDDAYVETCHGALTALGVPTANACWEQFCSTAADGTDHYKKQKRGSSSKRWSVFGKKK